MKLLDKLKALQLVSYSEEDIQASAEYLKNQEPALAYWSFWTAHLEGTDLPNPTKGCDWKTPQYASGVGAWKSICEINGWA